MDRDFNNLRSGAPPDGNIARRLTVSTHVATKHCLWWLIRSAHLPKLERKGDERASGSQEVVREEPHRVRSIV